MSATRDDLKLYRTTEGPLVEAGGRFFRVPEPSWDALFNAGDLHARLTSIAPACRARSGIKRQR
jgi:hypothetical protein